MNLRGRGGAIITIVSLLICIYATHATSTKARDGKKWEIERSKNPLFPKKVQSNDTAKKLETDRSLVYVDNSGGDSLNDLIIRAESANSKRGRYGNSNTKLSRNRRVIITLTTLGALGGGTAVIVGILLLRFFRWMFLAQGTSSTTTTFMSFIANLIRRVVGFFPGGMGILNILGFGASAMTTKNGKTQIPFWLQFQQQSTPHHTYSPNNIGLISNILHWYTEGNEKRHEYDSDNYYPTDHYNNYNNYNNYNYQSDYQKNPSDYDYLYPSGGDGSVYPSGTDADSYGYDYSTDKKNPRVEINQYYQTYPNDQLSKRPRVTTDWTSTTDPWGSDVQSFTDDVENPNSMVWPLLYPGQLKDVPTGFDRPLTSTIGGGLTKNQIIVTGPTKVIVSAGTMYIVFPDPISGETKQIPYENAYPKYTDPTTKIVYITYNEVKSGNTYIIPQNAQFRCTETFRKQFRRC